MSDGLMNQLRLSKLDEDIAVMEAAITDSEENPSAAGQEESVLDDNNVISPEEPTKVSIELTDEILSEVTVPKDTQPSDSEELAKLRKELSDATHRFNRYKGKTDDTLFSLRTENANLNTKLAQVIKDNSELKKASQEGDAIGEETRSILGDEATDTINGLKKEILELKGQFTSTGADQYENAAESHMATNFNEFMTELTRLVPDVSAMNNDASFNEWLRQTDKYGRERLTVLRSDQARFDYVRVAAFFEEYKSSQESEKIGPKDKKTPVKDSIEAHRGPTGKQGNSSAEAVDPANKGFIKQSEINKFQSDVSKGKYKYDSAKAEAMETKIFQAMNDGKIIADEAPTHQFRIS